MGVFHPQISTIQQITWVNIFYTIIRTQKVICNEINEIKGDSEKFREIYPQNEQPSECRINEFVNNETRATPVLKNHAQKYPHSEGCSL